MNIVEAQTYTRIDTSHNYTYVKNALLPSTRSIAYYSGYDQIEKREYQNFDTTSLEWQYTRRTLYDNSLGLSITLSEKWDTTQNTWTNDKRTTSESFHGSHEDERRTVEKWSEKALGFILTDEFIREYRLGIKEKMERNSSFNEDDGLQKRGIETLYILDDFGNTIEKISKTWDKEEKNWFNDKWEKKEYLGDTCFISYQIWNRELEEWEEDESRKRYLYFSFEEMSILLPSQCRGEREVKEYLQERYDTILQDWIPTKRTVHSHKSLPDNILEKSRLEQKWDRKKSKWVNQYIYKTKLDEEGHRIGHLREKWNKDEIKWQPDSQDTIEPNDDGYLHSIKKSYDKKSGKWKSKSKRKYKPCYPVKKGV